VHSSSTGTLRLPVTEVFPCFFLGCKANARVKPAKTGHGRHSSKIFVLFFKAERWVNIITTCNYVDWINQITERKGIQEFNWQIQGVPLASETGISLIILTPMKILQRNLNRSTFVVWEMKRNVSVDRFKFRCNILITVTPRLTSEPANEFFG